MTIDEIIQWLQDKAARPAPPTRVASELSICNTANMDAARYDNLLAGLRLRFFSAARRQFSQAQDDAIAIAINFGKSPGVTATAFPNLNRHKIAVQMISRIIDPSLLNQGGTNLCGPASVVMALIRNKPVVYAQTCRTLADHGSAPLGTLNLRPRVEILNYNRTNPPEADWIMCASLRNDTTAVTDALHGLSGPDDMFAWLTGSGYGKVVMLVEFPLRNCKLAPAGILPVDASMSKENMVKLMADLSARDWKIFLFAFGDIATAARTLDAQQQSVLDYSADVKKPNTQNPATNKSTFERAQESYDRAFQAESANLQSQNLNRVQLAWNVLRGRTAQHTFHLTYVDRVRVTGDDIELSCYNWGNNSRWVKLPFDGFVNKFCGFAAATD